MAGIVAGQPPRPSFRHPHAAQWRAAWQSLPQQLVPVMVLPDGYVSRGLGALARLAEAIGGANDPLRGR